MTSPHIRHHAIRLAVAGSAAATTLSLATNAWASQGPGGGPGGASAATQLAMAIIVYGSSALVICAGLIGAVRQR